MGQGRTSVLCLDIEGGFGGSSRSLYYLVRNLDRERFAPEVWHRLKGPIEERYRQEGVPTRHVPEILSLIPLRRNNWKAWTVMAPKVRRFWRVGRAVVAAQPDVLHLNYEGLVPQFQVLKWLGWRGPTVMHLRYNWPRNLAARVYSRILSRGISHFVFINEVVRDSFLAQRPDLARVPHTVLYNTVDRAILDAPVAEAGIAPLRVVFLGKLDYIKAADRLPALAVELKRRGLPVVMDVYGGSPRVKKHLVFTEDNLTKLRDEAQALGVADLIRFHGHVNDPEAALAGAGLLVRPSRQDDPWGRDVIESLSYGIPVLTHGRYDGFVRHGENGFLLEGWDVSAYADMVERCCATPGLLAGMSRAAKELARRLFDPHAAAAVMEGIYESVR